jgi:phospholipid transport system substrate-binding protein
VALGRQWRALEPDEREQFVELLTRVTVATYASRFDGYSGERFELGEEDDAPQGLRRVRSRIARSDGEDVELDYRLRSVDGSWRIIDVFLNGTVSELALRRAEYTSVIDRRGYPALIEALEERILVLAASGPAGD